jgi:hypothetical protein
MQVAVPANSIFLLYILWISYVIRSYLILLSTVCFVAVPSPLPGSYMAITWFILQMQRTLVTGVYTHKILTDNT